MRRLLRYAVVPLAAVATLAVGGPSAPASVTAAPAAAGGHSVRITAIGDTILGRTPTLPAHPRRWFRGIRRPLTQRADVVFGNLEGALTNATANKCGGSSGGNCYAFRNPPAFAHVFADVGFTVLNSANNHSHDFYATGVRETADALSRAGIAQAGVRGHTTYVTASGRRIAFLGFAPYKETPDLRDIPAAVDAVRAAHAHADIVVVYMHAGAEGAGATHVTGNEEYAFGEDRGNPQKFAHHVIRAGADLVIASGPHVLRGMEFYRGHLVAYSLANSASFHNFNTSGDLSKSAVLRVRLGPRGRYLGGRLVSVRLIGPGRPVRAGGSVSFVRRLSREDFGAHAARLSRAGRVRPPR